MMRMDNLSNILSLQRINIKLLSNTLLTYIIKNI